MKIFICEISQFSAFVNQTGLHFSNWHFKSLEKVSTSLLKLRTNSASLVFKIYIDTHARTVLNHTYDWASFVDAIRYLDIIIRTVFLSGRDGSHGARHNILASLAVYIELLVLYVKFDEG
jgi:hypothetical protein